MVGILFGIGLGATEYFLLRRLIDSITKNKPIPVWAVLGKMIALAVFLVPCGLLVPKQLVHAGVSAVVVLLSAAAVHAMRNKGKGDDGTCERP